MKPHRTDVCIRTHTHITPQHNECVPVFVFICFIYKAENCFQPYLAAKKRMFYRILDLSATPIPNGQTMEWRDVAE